jgi:hypothetical protein
MLIIFFAIATDPFLRPQMFSLVHFPKIESKNFSLSRRSKIDKSKLSKQPFYDFLCLDAGILLENGKLHNILTIF